jgi:hypothetical protein
MAYLFASYELDGFQFRRFISLRGLPIPRGLIFPAPFAQILGGVGNEFSAVTLPLFGLLPALHIREDFGIIRLGNFLLSLDRPGFGFLAWINFPEIIKSRNTLRRRSRSGFGFPRLYRSLMPIHFQIHIQYHYLSVRCQ